MRLSAMPMSGGFIWAIASAFNLLKPLLPILMLEAYARIGTTGLLGHHGTFAAFGYKAKPGVGDDPPIAAGDQAAANVKL